jgi:hypothetical protein
MAKIYVYPNGEAHYAGNDTVGVDIDGDGPIKVVDATEENMALYFTPETIEKINELRSMIQLNQR